MSGVISLRLVRDPDDDGWFEGKERPSHQFNQVLLEFPINRRWTSAIDYCSALECLEVPGGSLDRICALYFSSVKYFGKMLR